MEHEDFIPAGASACCGPDCREARKAEHSAAPFEIKRYVREKYAEIVLTHGEAVGGADAGCAPVAGGMGEAYDEEAGYVPEADLGLGCGLPTRLANLKPGDTVLDLGAGAGIDAFVARAAVGAEGRVFGVDMTPEMVVQARRNAEKLGYTNVVFLEGDIEALPLADEQVDVVVSNCVLNLVPDKAKAFAEMHRVLRPGGHFCVSDIVAAGDLPDAVRRSAEAYAGCVAGAWPEEAYLDALREAGFRDVHVVRRRPISLPERLLTTVLDDDERAAFRASGAGIRSVTIYGEKA